MVQFRRSVSVLLGLSVIALAGCDLEYWWSRGQPPSSQTLYSRAASQVSARLQSTKRDDVRKDIEQIVSELQATNNTIATARGGAELKSKLQSLTNLFAQLEGRLSVGQRASYGELLGQLSGFTQVADATGTVDPNTFSLYSARTMFFLANELGVPAPVSQQ